MPKLQLANQVRRDLTQSPLLRPLLKLLDDENIVGFIIAVVAAIVVANIPLPYKQAILAFIMGGALVLLGFTRRGREILSDNAETIGAAVQTGLDEVEEVIEIDIDDEWEERFVDRVVERLKGEGFLVIPPTTESDTKEYNPDA